jgi:hypothetical protein
MMTIKDNVWKNLDLLTKFWLGQFIYDYDYNNGEEDGDAVDFHVDKW